MSYGVVDLIARMIGLITSPITTRLLTLSQYGAGPLLSAVWAPVALLQYGGMDSSYPYFRARTDDEAEAKNMLATATFVSSSFTLMLWSIFAVVGLYGFWLSEYASVTKFELFLFMMGVLPASLLYWFLYILRFMKHTKLFVRITILSRIAPAFLVIPLLLSIGQGDRLIASWSAGLALQYISLFYALYVMKKAQVLPNIRARFSMPLAKKMLRYGLFLAPVGMIYSLTTVVDRILVGYYLGAESVALLQIAISIGGVGMMLAAWFGMAFDPHIVEWIGSNKIKEHRKRLQNLIHIITATFLGFTCGAAIWSEWLFYFLYPSQYMVSADLVPYLFFAGVFPVLSRIAIATIMIANKPKIHMAIYIGAFIINLMIGLFFIAKVGVMGAVYGTIFAEAFILLCWIMLGNLIFRNFILKWGTTLIAITATGFFVFTYTVPAVGQWDGFILASLATITLTGLYFSYLRISLGKTDFLALVKMPLKLFMRKP